MKKVMMFAIGSLAVLGSVASSGAAPVQSDPVWRYERALDRACQMRVEPGTDADRLYPAAHAVAPYLPDPEMAADECFQTQ